jgi:hypothetical protein
MEILQYIINNIEAIVAGATLVLGGLAIIAKITPSPTDDKWIAKILAFLKLVPMPKKEK